MRARPGDWQKHRQVRRTAQGLPRVIGLNQAAAALGG
jgi:hypothetical protein